MQRAWLAVRVRNPRQELTLQHPGPLELGRGPADGLPRLVVDDPYMSRHQLRLRLVDDGQLDIEVLGRPAALADGRMLPSGESARLPPPVQLAVGHSEILVDVVDGGDGSVAGGDLHALEAPPAAPPTLRFDLHGSPPPHQLANWFQTLLDVQRSAAGSEAFYGETAVALVELIGLDRGMVLLRRSGEWEVVAQSPAGTADVRQYSHRVLAEVVRSGRTLFQSFAGHSPGYSLGGIEAVVASPVIDAAGTVIGALYGSRDIASERDLAGIRPLEAQLVQVLAAAVGTGLARARREAEALRNRILFEQFASPELARELERQPTLLEGHERDVTILFCDLRNYSRIAESLAPALAYRLLGHVMDCFTERILELGGVIIDYFGDGLAAMWNAPLDQPDHALRAARAACAIHDELPSLGAAWRDRIGCTLDVGIGLASGRAQVGNAGSRRRVKYGPRGHVVNLAARVEQATRALGVPALVTGDTRDAIAGAFMTRRLCTATLPGITEPVALHELALGGIAPDWSRWAARYEDALQAHEGGRHADARARLQQLFAAHPDAADDQPARLLAGRVERALDSATDEGTAWPLGGRDGE